MPPHPHSHWRGTKDWKDLGLEMSTTSDEAAKMFDACIAQMLSYQGDESLGGMEGTAEKMMKADPNFVLGHVFTLGTKGMKVSMDTQFAQDIYKMVGLSKQPHVLPWERKHAEAVKLFAEGFIDKAAVMWEDILNDHPTDILALKFLHDMYIVNGSSKGLLYSTAAVVNQWEPSMPYYGNVLGMHAFGLEENGRLNEAEKLARQALDINRYDAWAVHCVAHVKETTGQTEEGIKFMKETEADWSDCSLQCHNYWHWGLFYYEKGDFESALGILDSHVMAFMKDKKSLFSVTDAASLCFRLEAEGVEIGHRWKDCRDVGASNDDYHLWSFSDLNVLLSCIGSQQKEEGDRLVNKVKEFVRGGYGDIQSIYADVTLPVMEAMKAYEAEDFGAAVDLMKPIQLKLVQIGGSNAQRDLFTLFTIHAAIRSKVPEHQKYASRLLHERKCLKGESPLAERLLQQLMISH